MWRTGAALRVLRMSALPSALGMGKCCKCGNVTHARRVSRYYEYLCDPCAWEILNMSIVDFSNSYATWAVKAISPLEVRKTVEQRRKLLTKGQANATDLSRNV